MWWMPSRRIVLLRSTHWGKLGTTLGNSPGGRSVEVMRFGAAVALGLVAAAPVFAAQLPPQTLRGPETRLRQYPTLSAATPAERAAARRLRGRMQLAALR